MDWVLCFDIFLSLGKFSGLLPTGGVRDWSIGSNYFKRNENPSNGIFVSLILGFQGFRLMSDRL